MSDYFSVTGVVEGDLSSWNKTSKQVRADLDSLANYFDKTLGAIRKRSSDSFGFDPRPLRNFSEQSKTFLDNYTKNVSLATKSTRELAVDVRSFDRLLQLVSVSAFARQIRSMAGGIVTTTAKFQDYNSTLLAITKSQEKATELFKQFQDYSIKTRFNLAEVMGGGVQLEAVIKTLDNVKVTTKEALELAGEMAMTYGKDLPLAIETVSKALSGSGRAAQMLKNNFGVTNSELEKFGVSLTRTGGVILRTEGDRKVLYNAIKAITKETTNFKAIDLQKNNLSVQLEALTDKFAILANELGKSVLPALNLVLDKVISFIDAMSNLPGVVKLSVASFVLLSGAFALFIEKFAAAGILIYTFLNYLNSATTAMTAEAGAMGNLNTASNTVIAATGSLATAQKELASSIALVNAALAAQQEIISVLAMPQLLAAKEAEAASNAAIIASATKKDIGKYLIKNTAATAPLVSGLDVGADAALLAGLGGFNPTVKGPGGNYGPTDPRWAPWMTGKDPRWAQWMTGVNPQWASWMTSGKAPTTSMDTRWGPWMTGRDPNWEKLMTGSPGNDFLGLGGFPRAGAVVHQTSPTSAKFINSASKVFGPQIDTFGAVEQAALQVGMFSAFNRGNTYSKPLTELPVPKSLEDASLGGLVDHLESSLSKLEKPIEKTASTLERLFPTFINILSGFADSIKNLFSSLGSLLLNVGGANNAFISVVGKVGLLGAAAGLLAVGIATVYQKLVEAGTRNSAWNDYLNNEQKRIDKRTYESRFIYQPPTYKPDGQVRGADLIGLPPEEVAVGEVVVLRPGERVALDGEVGNVLGAGTGQPVLAGRYQPIGLKDNYTKNDSELLDVKEMSSDKLMDLNSKPGMRTAYLQSAKEDQKYLNSQLSNLKIAKANPELIKSYEEALNAYNFNIASLENNTQQHRDLLTGYFDKNFRQSENTYKADILEGGGFGAADKKYRTNKALYDKAFSDLQAGENNIEDGKIEEYKIKMLEALKEMSTATQQLANNTVAWKNAGQAYIPISEQIKDTLIEAAGITGQDADSVQKRFEMEVRLKNLYGEQKKEKIKLFELDQQRTNAGKEFVTLEEKRGQLNALIQRTKRYTPEDVFKIKELETELIKLDTEIVVQRRKRAIESAKIFKTEKEVQLLEAKEAFIQLQAMGFSRVEAEKMIAVQIGEINRTHHANLRKLAMDHMALVEAGNQLVFGNTEKQLSMRESRGEDTSAARILLGAKTLAAAKKKIDRDTNELIKVAEDDIARAKVEGNLTLIKTREEDIKEYKRQAASKKEGATFDEVSNRDQATVAKIKYDIDLARGKAETAQSLNSSRLDLVKNEYARTGRVYLEHEMLRLMDEEVKRQSELLKLKLDEAMLTEDKVKGEQLVKQYLADQASLQMKAAKAKEDELNAISKAKLEKEQKASDDFYARGEATMGGMYTWEELQKRDAEAAQKEAADRKARIFNNKVKEAERRNKFIAQIGLSQVPFDSTTAAYNKAEPSSFKLPSFNPRESLNNQTKGLMNEYFDAKGNKIGRPDIPNIKNGEIQTNEHVWVHLMLDGKEVGTGRARKHGSQNKADNPYSNKNPSGGL